MKKLRQSVSATARWEAERKAAAQLPLVSDLDFDNPRQLQEAATRIAKAIRAEAKGSRCSQFKNTYHMHFLSNTMDHVAVRALCRSQFFLLVSRQRAKRQ